MRRRRTLLAKLGPALVATLAVTALFLLWAGSDPGWARTARQPVRESLAVQVVDAGGRAAGGARVEMRYRRASGRLAGPKRFSASGEELLPFYDPAPEPDTYTTGPDGRCEVPMPERKSWLRAAKLGHGRSVASVVEPTQRGRTVVLRLREQRIVRGCVRDQAGRPLPGALLHGVQRLTQETEDPLHEAEVSGRTDSDGEFALAILAGLASEWRAEALGLRGAPVSVASHASGSETLELVVPIHGRIRGRVRTADDRPAGYAEVHLRATELAGAEVARLEASEDGTFEIGARAAGRYTLLAVDDLAGCSPPVDVAVDADGGTRNTDLVLRPYVRLAGTVVDSEDAPVRRAEVLVVRLADGYCSVRTVTHADGGFVLGKVAADQDLVLVVRPFPRLWLRALTLRAPREPVRVVVEKAALESVNAFLRVRVQTPTGGAVPGASVELTVEDGPLGPERHAIAPGEDCVELTDIPAGRRLAVRAEAPGHAPAVVDEIVVGPEEGREVVLRLDKR